MSNTIHHTAIISPKATIGENNSFGPYVIVEEDVVIGDNNQFGPMVCIYNGARIGNNNTFHQAVSVSHIPQDLKFCGEPTEMRIGDNNVFHEFVTMHRGTKETGFTSVGSNTLLMAYVHVAHDCVVGSNVVVANLVQMGGHVHIEDWVTVGGMTAVVQFFRIGKHAMVGGGFKVVKDVPPFILAGGEPLRFSGLNVVGLRRRGFSNQDISEIKDIYRLIYDAGLLHKEAAEKILEKYPESIYAKDVVSFMEHSKKGILGK